MSIRCSTASGSSGYLDNCDLLLDLSYTMPSDSRECQFVGTSSRVKKGINIVSGAVYMVLAWMHT